MGVFVPIVYLFDNILAPVVISNSDSCHLSQIMESDTLWPSNEVRGILTDPQDITRGVVIS